MSGRTILFLGILLFGCGCVATTMLTYEKPFKEKKVYVCIMLSSTVALALTLLASCAIVQ